MQTSGGGAAAAAVPSLQILEGRVATAGWWSISAPMRGLQASPALLAGGIRSMPPAPTLPPLLCLLLVCAAADARGRTRSLQAAPAPAALDLPSGGGGTPGCVAADTIAPPAEQLLMEAASGMLSLCSSGQGLACDDVVNRASLVSIVGGLGSRQQAHRGAALPSERARLDVTAPPACHLYRLDICQTSLDFPIHRWCH